MITRAGLTLLVFGISIFFKKKIHPFSQVLFTADLKSFSSYGLDPPSSALPPSISSTPEKRAKKLLQQSVLALQIPPVTPSVSPLKRKRDPGLGDHVEISPVNTAEHCLEAAETWNVDDRVKKRR